MEKLGPLRRHNASIIFGAFFSIMSLSAIVAIALQITLNDSALAYAGGAGIAIIGSVVASITLGHSTTKTSEFLAQAILHVQRDNQIVGAPDINSVPNSRDFLNNLAQSVYEMATRAGLSDGLLNTPSDSTEKFLRILVQSIPLAIFALDKSGVIIFANQAGANYAAIKIPDSYGQKFYDVVKLSFASSDTLESWLRSSESSKATDTRTWERVQLELDQDIKKQCDMAVHFSKDNPEGIETVIILFDQTVRYQKDDHGASFISLAVHELRTPLTVMRGYIELFEEEIAPKLDPEQTEFMRNLSAQAQQLGAFISNVQNFARIEENELSLNLKEEAWAPIVEGAIRDMNLRANVRKKTLLCQIQPNLPLVAVDRSTIYEVLVNLIENAVKYTHSDSPIIIRTYKKDENWVETVVEDKGIGIPDSVMAHIFDKFYRSHRSSKTVGGTGLGLYLSKTIISAHGGEIWVKSHEGEGSTFGFTVPTLSSVASELTSSDNKAIVRGAHGWIKNHSLYRG